jgi:hypothetical protein
VRLWVPSSYWKKKKKTLAKARIEKERSNEIRRKEK